MIIENLTRHARKGLLPIVLEDPDKATVAKLLRELATAVEAGEVTVQRVYAQWRARDATRNYQSVSVWFGE